MTKLIEIYFRINSEKNTELTMEQIFDLIEKEYTDLQTASLREELDDYKEITENYQVHTRELNQKISELEKSKLEWEQAYVNRFNESQKQKTKIHSLEQRVRRLEDGLKELRAHIPVKDVRDFIDNLLTSPQGE